MRDYETVMVLHPSYEDKEVEAEIQAVSGIITASGGSVLEIDRWGRRRLAYEIKKAHEGIYTLVRWRGGPQIPEEIRRRFRLNERMLRFMTIFSEGPYPASPRAEAEGPGAATPATAPASEGSMDETLLTDRASAASADGPAAEERRTGRSGD